MCIYIMKLTPMLMPKLFFSFKFKIFIPSQASSPLIFSCCSISLHFSHTRITAAAATTTAATTATTNSEAPECPKPVKGLRMSSPYTGPRLIRCRVRDLASCFYACRLPLEEEPDISCSKSPQTTSKNTVFDAKGDCKASAKMSIAKKMEGESAQSSSYNVNRTNGGELEPRFSEEDYMVFCFREDGAIHMMNESKSSKAYDENHKNESDESDADNEIKEMIKPVEQPNASCKMDSLESCDANVSDTRTSSFAFPVLGIEWIGSPVRMPKSGEHDEDDDQSVRIGCCRF